MTTELPRIIALDNPVRDYAWGSTEAIPRLLGQQPTDRPVAELWIGAHPDSPSRARCQPDRPGLDELIDRDPARLLGRRTVERFGPRLPFLLKVLAADRALSMQVHPNASQAQAGFEAERRAGVPPAERNYTDPQHKPELALALTEFDAFCGFRQPERTAELLDELAVPQLRPYRDLLLGADGLRATFTTLLSLRGQAREELLTGALAGCRRLAGGSRWAAEARASLLAAGDFPGDLGAVLALLLNFVRLAPGEAIFLGAGNVHAYLRGTCVEVLANSDNVLRCGLTPKHVDIPELVRIADFSPLAEPRWQPEQLAGGGCRFSVPVEDFGLQVPWLAAGELALPAGRPYLVLNGERPAVLAGSDGDCRLGPWQAVFLAAGPDDAGCTLTGSGRAFVVSTGGFAGTPE